MNRDYDIITRYTQTDVLSILLILEECLRDLAVWDTVYAGLLPEALPQIGSVHIKGAGHLGQGQILIPVVLVQIFLNQLHGQNPAISRSF